MAAQSKELAPLIVIVGPTASGKSDLAMQIARRHDGEIICADSRTVYKGLDIGTAKPSLQDRQEIPHHLLDVVGPDQEFSVADFKRLALAAIADIGSRGKLAIMVGGTGLYVDAVLFDYQFGPRADSALRQQLEAMSITELQEHCSKNNIKIPENNQNKRYLVRAIEVGGLQADHKVMRSNTLVVGLSINSEELLPRIIKRAEVMLKAGILDEVRHGGAQYGWEHEAMSGNIYRIMRRHLDGEIALHEALHDSVRSDIQLAKRQRTWLKRNPSIKWVTSPLEALDAIGDFLNHHPTTTSGY